MPPSYSAEQKSGCLAHRRAWNEHSCATFTVSLFNHIIYSSSEMQCWRWWINQNEPNIKLKWGGLTQEFREFEGWVELSLIVLQSLPQLWHREWWQAVNGTVYHQISRISDLYHLVHCTMNKYKHLQLKSNQTVYNPYREFPMIFSHFELLLYQKMHK